MQELLQLCVFSALAQHSKFTLCAPGVTPGWAGRLMPSQLNTFHFALPSKYQTSGAGGTHSHSHRSHPERPPHSPIALLFSKFYRARHLAFRQYCSCSALLRRSTQWWEADRQQQAQLKPAAKSSIFKRRRNKRIICGLIKCCIMGASSDRAAAAEKRLDAIEAALAASPSGGVQRELQLLLPCSPYL